MWDLEIYASVTIHDREMRWNFERQVLDMGAKAERKGETDILEIRFKGNRETVMRLSELCETCLFHDIRVYRAEY